MRKITKFENLYVNTKEYPSANICNFVFKNLYVVAKKYHFAIISNFKI